MMPDDMWRVDVAGYQVNVRGEHAKDYLEQVNQRLARMTMALHRIIAHGAPAEFEQIARDALGQGERG